MANRRFEMYEYRQVLVRMRLGDTDRALARAGLMGRHKAAELRAVAAAEGWLHKDSPLPDEATLAARVRRPATTKSSTTSAVEPYREEVLGLWESGIQGTTIHDYLVRRHRFEASYSRCAGSSRRTPSATRGLDDARLRARRGPRSTSGAGR